MAAHTKQDVAYGNHEKSDLKGQIDIFKDSFEMMSWWSIISIVKLIKLRRTLPVLQGSPYTSVSMALILANSLFQTFFVIINLRSIFCSLMP